MNHTTLAMVIALSAALVTGASLAIPSQQVNATSDHQKQKHVNNTNIKTAENQANACKGDLTFCYNLLRNVNCVKSICVIGDITPWAIALPH